MKKLDPIDRRILSELSEDCRQEQSVLARKLQIGRDRVKYRIAKLREQGAIENLVTLVNPTKLGISLYKTYFRLNSNRQLSAQLVSYLDKHPRTFWIAECAGHWDLILVTFARTPKEYSLLQDQFLSRFHDAIVDTSVATVTDAWYFGRGYLSGTTSCRLYVGGDDDEVSIDELDLQILGALSGNADLSYAALAMCVGCTPATVRARTERLEQSGVVAYYRVEMALSLLGRCFYKAQVFFSEHDPRREDELKAFCQAELDIVFLVKQIGDCRVEIELEVESFETYNQVIDRLRDRFGGYIKRVDTLVIRKQRIRGVPMDVKPLTKPVVKSSACAA